MAEYESLKDLKKLLSLVSAPLIVCEVETQKILFGNESAQELTGYDGENIQGFPMEDLFCAEDHKILKAIFDLCKENYGSLKVRESDLHIRRRTGRICDVNLSGVSVQIKFQQILVITLQDLTEIRRQELERENLIEETARVSKLADIGRLAAGMAHELNNPLAILIGYAENLSGSVLASEASREKILEDLVPIEKAAQRMSKIISKMLSQLRNEPQIFKATPLRRVVEDSLALLEGVLASQSIQLEVSIDDCWIQCDETGIEQIITNIVTNAANALDLQKNRTVRVRTHLSQDTVRLEIWNNGNAIPDEVKPKLFTPFFTTKEVGEGTGLGLYMSYQIMKAHQGELNFDSHAQRGTSFFLNFPRIKKPSLTVSPAGLKALIIDDDTFFRKLMCKKLERLGVACVESRDGKEGIDLLQSDSSTFDMIFVDFKMPRMDGGQFIELVNQKKLQIPVVLISGALSVSELQSRLIDNNLFASISKPVETSELEMLIDKIAIKAQQKKLIPNSESA